ncbi:MAG: divergent polysaccharide deacetylase family protein [Pseudomonadota bacterium]
MADDELSAPLGKNPKTKSRFPLAVLIPWAIAGVLGLCVAVFAGWALVVDDPYGGEPMVVVAATQTLNKAEPARSGAAQPETKAEIPKAPNGKVITMPTPDGAEPGPRVYDGPEPRQSPVPGGASLAPGTPTVTIIDGSTGKRQEVPIGGASAPQDPRARVESKLLESSRHGKIPRVGPDGSRPAEVYAKPVKLASNRTDAPRIVIVVGGLGVSTAATDDAIAKLPAPVTFAFAPYGPEVDRAATRARADGHEVLLQLPMEPFEYPDNDPGPQTMLMSLSADQNIDRLYWLMSRFQGYVGVVNFMGARFTSSEPALSPVLREVGKRGLIYVDDGTSPRSLASQITNANNLPFAKADIVLDSVPTPANIDRSLTRLEALARERGIAVGMAAASPASIDRIAQWAKALEGRGISLVPVTAITIKPKSS